MLHSPRSPNYLLFLGVIGILMLIFLGSFRRGISNAQELPDFTDPELSAVRRQILALLGIPLSLVFIILSPLSWKLAQPFIFFVALIIGFAPLAYISISSIRNRVSIFRGRKSLAVKGTRAVRKGVMYLLLIIFIFIGFALYFTSLK